mmetsp:Transcript_48944/g.114887  ORF Transcript_48944/g.114887 Transcript_48944/m.114887 type:complete len:225 (-) Transcript_48944:293-967(-)
MMTRMMAQLKKTRTSSSCVQTTGKLGDLGKFLIAMRSCTSVPLSVKMQPLPLFGSSLDRTRRGLTTWHSTQSNSGDRSSLGSGLQHTSSKTPGDGVVLDFNAATKDDELRFVGCPVLLEVNGEKLNHASLHNSHESPKRAPVSHFPHFCSLSKTRSIKHLEGDNPFRIKGFTNRDDELVVEELQASSHCHLCPPCSSQRSQEDLNVALGKPTSDNRTHNQAPNG